MAIKYLVDLIKQATWKDCWYTAILMLVRYKRFLLNLKYGGGNVLWEPWQDIDSNKASKELKGLYKKGDVPDFVYKYKFLSRYISKPLPKFRKSTY